MTGIVGEGPGGAVAEGQRGEVAGGVVDEGGDAPRLSCELMTQVSEFKYRNKTVTSQKVRAGFALLSDRR